MAQKLWEKNVQVNAEIDRFTVGRDREMDLYLAKHDVLGSMAHITMLESIGLLKADELDALYNYKYEEDNLSLKLMENQLLYHLSTQFDKDSETLRLSFSSRYERLKKN